MKWIFDSSPLIYLNFQNRSSWHVISDILDGKN